MGCLSSSSSKGNTWREEIQPKPYNFTIKRIKQVNHHLVVMLNYPNCVNFNGDKILVYLKTLEDDFLKRTTVDPHFLDSDNSPFARFSPTKSGWISAIQLAGLL
jgi:hypothetical protein